jgi:hypothetical protein
MASESSSMDQAISRAMRASLNGLQRQTEELHQAVADLIAACSSSRPSNALPHTLRAQTAAASLAASLEVLGRFIASAGQSSSRAAVEEEPIRAVAASAEPVAAEVTHQAPAAEVENIPQGEDVSEGDPAFANAPQQEIAAEPVQQMDPITEPELESVPAYPQDHSAEPVLVQSPSPEDTGTFDLHSLPTEQQDMHRRANRVAKVSMQDIQLIVPEKVRLGRENRDICIRLNDEIGKARKEYERRFQPILGHGVDYFYHWMVEVLAAGDPEALGEYPYSTPALHH